MLLRVLTAVLVLGCVAPVPSAAQDTPRTGGVLKVAIVGEPPSLDIPLTTATLTYELMWHVNESLFAYDKGFLPIPHLAEGDVISDRGLKHTITLRRGVRFHNGKEMTSADVVPSLKRWGAKASVGKQLWTNVESIEATGPYMVVIALKQPSASLLFGLSEPHAAIYPKESIEAAGDGTLKEFIGTGPFRFVEHRPDRHIKLARFKDYAARTESANGFGGKRTAYLDEILFIPTPDTAVRQSGTETGDFHYGMFVKQDAWERIKALPQLDPRIVKPRGWAVGVVNHKSPLMKEKKVRQAVQAALDMEPIMRAGFGHKDFFRLDPGLFFPEQPWHSTASAALYNQKNKDKARQLLKDAGYAKGSDGIYAKGGKPLSFELYFPSDFQDWAAAATYASDALNKFGIKITPRGAIRSTQLPDTNAGKFQIAVNPWGIGNPHPQPSLVRPFREFNKDLPTGGMKYPLTQQYSGGTINFDTLLDDAITGFDTAKQKDPIQKIAQAFNELLPIIPIYERLNNNPINDKARTAGWPGDSDKVYQQGGADNFAVVMIMDGTLHKI